MIVLKHEKKYIIDNVMQHFSCDECRKKIETEDMYTINLATNKNNGVNILLCSTCAQNLKDNLNEIVKY